MGGGGAANGRWRGGEWEVEGLQMGGGGAANGRWRGGKWEVEGRQIGGKIWRVRQRIEWGKALLMSKEKGMRWGRYCGITFISSTEME